MQSVPGVSRVETDTARHTATVVFDDTKTNVAEMRNMLENNGYPVESVTYENMPPVAEAGYYREIVEGTTVTLDASGSHDDDDGIAEYLWQQTGGMSVTLADADSVQARFTAPRVGPEGEMLTFRVTVTDMAGLYASDTVTLRIVGGYEGGVKITPELRVGASIHTLEKGPIDGIWRKRGESTTEAGHRVIWGYFHANPGEVGWGSVDNPEVFVKIWFDKSGRIDVNYFHVSVPDVEVVSDDLEDENPPSKAMVTMSRRYVRQYYENGESGSEENIEDGHPPSGYETEGNASGYAATDTLGMAALIHTEGKGILEALWSKGGEDTTKDGHGVVWGHFYANPSDVDWGSPDNPELFVKIWFDAGGRVDVNFFHVSVPDIEVYSDFPRDGVYDREGMTVLENRYVRHEY